MPVPAALIALVFVVIAIFGEALSPERIDGINLAGALRPPVWAGGSWDHPLGTDQLGRDVLSELLHGARASGIVAASAVVLAGALGTVLGLIAGRWVGVPDFVISRVVEMAMSMPPLLFVILLATSFDPGLFPTVLALTFVSWVPYARLVRAQTFKILNMDYILAAKAVGVYDARILIRHVLPNVVNSIIVLASVQVGALIIAEASLSFLGLGIQPPKTSWGLMVASGRQHLTTAWWLTAVPGVALLITVLSLNLMGNWIMDRLDPIRRGTG
jgi:peptide/nickel transport system permease protein